MRSIVASRVSHVGRRALATLVLTGAVAACASTGDESAGEGERGEGALGGAASLVARRADDASLVIDGAIEEAWSDATAVSFDTAWSGVPTGTSTEVRALWSERALYLLWELRGANLHVDATRPTATERDKLYEEDCVEMFLAPDPAERRRYFEIELGPRGHFFDLLVDRRTRTASDVAWSSAPEIRTTVDVPGHRVVIEAAIRAPDVLRALVRGAKLPLGLFRLEGQAPNRQYLAWRPTRTPRPNFHVPEAFGSLVLE